MENVVIISTVVVIDEVCREQRKGDVFRIGAKGIGYIGQGSGLERGLYTFRCTMRRKWNGVELSRFELRYWGCFYREGGRLHYFSLITPVA